ncbi:protein S100-A12-like [Hemicordylus capensis]|uniref:protein S100-A12-like n=1 Tax=Hemicordylus capensis TaxID=884348 RepID=UPI002302D9B5|nr:protein S100-A12-like [Hemicordylus capensis]
MPIPSSMLAAFLEIDQIFAEYTITIPVSAPLIQANSDTRSRYNSDSLSRDGLRKLLDKQLPNYLKCPGDPKEFDELFKRLDQNCDQHISFEEFTVLIRDVMLTMYEK